MQRTLLLIVMLFGLFVAFGKDAAAQTPQSSPADKAHSEVNALGPGAAKSHDTPSAAAGGEVEALRQRVEELERQNRAMAQTLSEVQSKLESMNRPGTASAAEPAATVSPSVTPPQASAQSSQKDEGGNVRWSEIIGEGNKIKLYGFLRLDMIFDSQQPNNFQSILFIKSPDPRAGGNQNGDFTMHPRLTRLGLDWSGPRIARLGGAKLSGKLETDFQNGGTESRQIIRIRHAYLNLGWKEFSILAGQTWDVVSPLFPTVNSDTLQWNAGNIGDRRPQLRIAYEPKAGEGKFSFVGGVGLTGAIDSLDLDANGVRDGEESGRPNVQARVGFSHPLGAKERVASFGVSGLYGFMKTARPVAGRTEFRSQVVNVDFTLPVANRLAFKGEGWWGRNMSDFRGGAGQGVNAANGRAIRSRGGWGEANIKFSRYFSMNPGFSTDDPVDADVPSGGRTRNRSFYIANRITPGGNFLVGADYLRWKTNFKGFLSGIDNRVNIFLQYGF
ncbi:MAG TPA: hypothetical protein VE713_10880 [Pyrinomonadaceae bacterium]|nr:hypothetical protein [Pyrinomonadaceae bacterium]